MKRMMILSCLILFLAPIIWAQEKVVAPVWKVGDKWTYRADNGWEWTVETISIEKDFYVNVWLMPEGGSKGEWKQFYEKKNMNCVKVIKDGKEDKEERNRLKKRYDFPLYEGKKWSLNYSSYSHSRHQYYDCFEEFLVGGFEDVEVPAGKFRAIKVKVKFTVLEQPRNLMGIYHYWWSPDVKAIIKEQKEMADVWRKAEYMKYELISFELK